MILFLAVAGYWGWCYFVPEKADRIEQFAGGCSRTTEVIGGVVRPFSADLGDLIYGARNDAKEKCGQMWWWAGAGRADLDHFSDLAGKADHPHDYPPPGTGGAPAPGATPASGASVPEASGPASGAASFSAFPNASNPNSL
ncbi:hypothetical protein [Burkholderia sp. MBR-1]|uniref:hypothetical protein n=1 Tax=Burkholderia sp. MBR-1 TaxID=2732364 RepID=UPI0015EF6643|nr:hypothetical protein [Burkholderia sp. MBR-1]QMI49764.1 hypothetical protein MBR110_30280 [Burkholderia sp. MBR-1]